MTTDPAPLGRVERFAIRRVRRRVLDPVRRTVSSFDDVGGSTAGGWVPADPRQPALFERRPEELEHDLTAIWQAEGRQRLLPLARPVARLAERARRRSPEGGTEVSTDVYAMQ